jgi:hypothetical protein
MTTGLLCLALAVASAPAGWAEGQVSGDEPADRPLTARRRRRRREEDVLIESLAAGGA